MYTASDTPTTQLYSQLDPYKRTVSSQVELYPQKMDSKPQLYLLDNCVIPSTELTKNEHNINSVSALVELDPYTTYSVLLTCILRG